jgi:hypothetical protein
MLWSFGDNNMTIYDPIFGIYFLPPILSVVERIHITKSKEPDSAGDLLDLDSDAEHQIE